MEKQLPKNWVETDIETVADILDNLRKPVSSNERSKRLGEVPYYGATGQAGWIDDFIFNEELVLVGEDGAPFFDKLKNVAYIINGKSWVNNHAHVLKGKKVLSNKFLLHFFNQFDYTNYVGGTTRLKLNQGYLKSIPFPLPPLLEQHRIFAKLDTLFSQLETIKTSMANIPLLLKDFRQQVLTQAVTGKLTEEWREEKKMKVWEKLTLSELIVEKPRNGYSPRAVDYETPVKSLSLSATTSGSFDSSYVKYLDIEVPSKDSHLWLKNGDILIQRSNSLEYVGTSAIYDSQDFEFIYPDIMIKIRANEKITTNYLNYCMSSFKTREYFRNNATGTAGNMPKINQVVVMNTPINLPSYLEQEEIETRVESLFAKADVIEQQYKVLKASIDNLPQAILHKAFKGELSEQLDSDGDAKESLEEIKALKDATGKIIKSKTNKRAIKTVTPYSEMEEVIGMVAEEHYKK